MEKTIIHLEKKQVILIMKLSDGVNDYEYLKVIKYEIPRLIEIFEPDFIFYLSGVDIIESDKLGKLSVSINGCKERDKFILNYCKNNNIPIQISMGRGYSPDINTIVDAHANTFRLVQEIFLKSYILIFKVVLKKTKRWV